MGRFNGSFFRWVVQSNILFLLMINIASPAQESPRIRYHIGWDQPNLRFYDVTVTIEKPDNPVTQLRIPNWRPGRYMIQNFAQNVVEFRAENESGKPLQFAKIDKDTWEIATGNTQQLVAKYRFYANELDAGNTYLDDTEAYINPATILMYLPGKELLPVALSVQIPQDWAIATALDFDETLRAYPAENYHELADNPLIISATMDKLVFSHQNVRYDVAIVGNANYNAERMRDDLKKMVAEQVKIFGEAPFKRYVFLYHFVDYRMGHGVEHKNSTSIVVGPTDFSDESTYSRWLSYTAHEFFHAWNVERIRPEGIFYPDYSQPNYTELMWWFEGVTSYYEGITLTRMGYYPLFRYLGKMTNSITSLENNAGNRITSAAQASFDDWAKAFGAPPGTSISFYQKGEILGFLLDLEIRKRTNNQQSLDDVMRLLWKKYGSQQLGVPEKGIQTAIEAVAGSSFADFFERYVSGTETPDYGKYLSVAGLEIVEIDGDSSQPDLGVRLSGDERETRIRSVRLDSPAANGGLAIDDILLAVNGQRIHSENYQRIMNRFQPDETIRVAVFRRNQLREFEVQLSPNPAKRWVIRENPNATPAQKSVLNSWLNQ